MKQQDWTMESMILEDLKKRGEVAAFIVRTEEGLFQLISYNPNGTVQFITEPVEEMYINKRLEGNMISPLATIGKKK